MTMSVHTADQWLKSYIPSLEYQHFIVKKSYHNWNVTKYQRNTLGFYNSINILLLRKTIMVHAFSIE